MSSFPQALYRMPGIEKLDLGSFTTAMVHSEEQRDAMLADGWHVCQEDAVAANEPAPAPEPETAPTRAELEQKATELGLKFDGRTSDKKLGEMIGTALLTKD